VEFLVGFMAFSKWVFKTKTSDFLVGPDYITLKIIMDV